MARATCWRPRRRRNEVGRAQLRRVAAGAWWLPALAAAHASATPLDNYLGDLKTLRATFVQTLVDPHGREIDRATGTLIVARPGKFSWEIHPQGAASGGGAAAGHGQLMVCDGTNLGFFHRDFHQVTV